MVGGLVFRLQDVVPPEKVGGVGFKFRGRVVKSGGRWFFVD